MERNKYNGGGVTGYITGGDDGMDPPNGIQRHRGYSSEIMDRPNGSKTEDAVWTTIQT